jgi:hypothetical protein
MAIGYNPSIVRDGLVLCLDASNSKSYPGSGTTWADISGFARNATLAGSTVFNQNAIDLGTVANITNYVQLPNSVMTSLGDFTISFWNSAHNITSGDLNCLFHATNSGGNDFSIEWYNNRIQTLIGSTYSTFNYTFANNSWYNFVFSRSGAVMTLYLNGIAQGTAACPTTVFTITGAIVLGQEQDAVGGGFQAIQSFRGKYAAVAVYTRTLGANEVLQNFNALRGRFGV